MLTQTLRSLERDGPVRRTADREGVAGVDYELTPLGAGLLQSVLVVVAWAAEMVGELSIKSDEFAAIWAAHPVGSCSYTVRELDHPLVGRLTLNEESLDLPDSGGQRMTFLGATPGSDSADRLPAARFLDFLTIPEDDRGRTLIAAPPTASSSPGRPCGRLVRSPPVTSLRRHAASGSAG
jgi:hypothetical protein